MKILSTLFVMMLALFVFSCENLTNSSDLEGDSAVLLGLSGTANNVACVRNVDCSEGEVCLDGFCVPDNMPCNVNSECQDDEVYQ